MRFRSSPGRIGRAALRRARRSVGRPRGARASEPSTTIVPNVARALPPAWLAREQGSASTTIHARLTDDDVAAVEAWLVGDPELVAAYDGAEPIDRRRLILSFAVHSGNTAIPARAELSTAQAPEDVHAMARGPLAAAGGLYEADLVADALASIRVDPASLGAALDFGCSSGRVVRVLASAYPRVAWSGCDPNGQAIAWAQRALPAIDFFKSGDRPPLPLADGSLDLVYAISIWSHFEPQLGLRWLAEMRRIVRPGGHLVITTHGTTTIGHDVASGRRGASQGVEIAQSLYTNGTWYRSEFGAAGDWGVVNPDWGTAFVSAEWLLSHATPRWQLLEYAPGRNAGNQDVYVLRRS